MNLFGLVEEKDWRYRLLFFFAVTGGGGVVAAVAMAVAVVVAVADGRSGFGWCCEIFFLVEYIILL